MTSNEIRKTFLEYFSSKQHLVVASAPMVIKDDPSLMFTNAGMNQFKDAFLGNKPAPAPRVADTQKCLRVSGKHNDLEEVGHDTYHHTMFEMLGNWSFGDYFKKEAIEWGWDLLTNVYKIPRERLYVTVFEGDAGDKLSPDTQALEFWKQWVPEDQILFGNKKDNFWEMGDTGPCGPCSEIHADLRDEADRANLPGSELVNKGHHLVIEIWNLVFIEFNRKADGSLEKLPAQHVDTGMGFERLCMVLQGKKSNYDTDVFQPLIGHIARLSGIAYGSGEKSDIAMRVIADHIRAIAFAIADGQLPSNNKAGYVIRRILRRAVRYGFTFLNMKEPFLNALVAPLTEQLGEQFPELKHQQSLIQKVIAEEELSFLRTLDKGIHLLEQVVAQTKAAGSTKVDGRTVFELYDTYGFPLDLTELMLKEQGMSLGHEDFETAMKEQKERSRSAAATETDDWVVVREGEQTRFIGYDATEAEVKIVRYRKITTKSQTLVQLVFDITPFYAESGGQVGDSGLLHIGDEQIRILDTRKENNLILHIADNIPTQPSLTGIAAVDMPERMATARNHSATHLMHHALRCVLGSHVEQKGSLVHPEYLRFDFSHFQKMTREEIKAVEDKVNEQIMLNVPLEEHRSISLEEARSQGALMLFGEKYGDEVRMIRFGESAELCGGTHVGFSGSIGPFKITGESAIAAGVRRIEAITGQAAFAWFEQFIQLSDAIKTLTKNPVDPLKGVQNLIEQNDMLEEELAGLKKKHSVLIVGELKGKTENINGLSFLATQLDIDPASAKDIAFGLGEQIDNLFLVLGYEHAGKPGISVYVSPALTKEKGLNAGAVVKELAACIQGGGGGQAVFASAGGKRAEGISEAISLAKAIASR